jgi:hypothetical protein
VRTAPEKTAEKEIDGDREGVNGNGTARGIEVEEKQRIEGAIGDVDGGGAEPALITSTRIGECRRGEGTMME